MPEVVDHYKTLGLTRGATAAEIKQAYRTAAKAHHPDKNPGDPSAVVRFKLAAEAYAVLGDQSKRRAYDQRPTWSWDPPPASARDTEDEGPIGAPLKDFIRGMNSIFGKFVDDVVSDLSRDAQPSPADLEEIRRRAKATEAAAKDLRKQVKKAKKRAKKARKVD